MPWALGSAACSRSAPRPGFGQVRAGTVAASQVTQYCLPPRDNPDAHRFYCGNEDDSADQAGAAFRVLHAGGRGKSFAA